MLANSPSALYLRLPARVLPRDTGASLPVLSFAIAARGRLQRVGHASLPELFALMQQSQRVVLLLAASDVSLFNIAVPPLSPARLKAALPALVEDRVIGDPADCAIAVGPANGSSGAGASHERLVAVADRVWLQAWIDSLRRHGARRVSALPFALCLPLPAGHVAASVAEHGGQRELALRLSAQQGMGLPLSSEDVEQLPAEVFQLLSTFAGPRPVQLSLPPTLLEAFRQAYGHLAAGETAAASDRSDTQPVAAIALREENWAAWVEGAGHVSIDLASAIVADTGDATDWRRWRWPLALGAALLLLNVAALNWDWWQLRSEGQQLRESIERSFRRSFPNEAMADPVAQLRQKRAAARQAAGEFVPGDFIALSAALGDAWAEAGAAMGADARAIAAMDYRDAVLTVRFKPGQQPSLDAARAALAARGLEATAVAGDAAQWQVRSVR
jgi:general secretion pathway protein L